ncbi:MAG: Stp1/IreP family PP2C-type Ser/Thr phosphatase, partial [Anaerolineae bacterium]
MDAQQTDLPDSQDQGSADLPGPFPPQTFDLVAVKLTDVGRARPHNEDYVEFITPSDPEQLRNKGSLYLVADGMGGHQAGEVASKGAVEIVISSYYGDTGYDAATSLERAFHTANKQLHIQSETDISKKGMGTTLVAAAILGRKVYVANVGDSRAYLINSNEITQITEDHSWVEEQVRAGLLTPEQARRHPQRNLVTRALGSRPRVEVDIFEGEIGERDTLLLCSDGLTGRIEDSEIAALVLDHPPKKAVRKLVALANERGGKDNITALLVSAQQESATLGAAAGVPFRRESGQRLGAIPIMAGALVLLILALGLLLAKRYLPWGSFVAATTPLPVVSTDGLTPSPGASPIRETEVPPSDTPSPTPTESPSPTPTSSPEPTATLRPTFTSQPTAKPTNTPPPTATPAPATATASPTPSLEPTPEPTNTPLPTATPEPTTEPTNTPPPTATPAITTTTPSPTLDASHLLPAPQITFPGPGDTVSADAPVTVRWTWSETLDAGQRFDVRFWHTSESTPLGVDPPTAEMQLDVTLAHTDAHLQHGDSTYFLDVVVVQGDPYTVLSESAP